MNKTMVSLMLVALMIITSASATIELPKGKCTWARPATDYRPAQTFEGIWGRMSDGSIECFSPGRSKHKVAQDNKPSRCHTENYELCEEVETCDEVCKWKLVCDKWKGFGCHKWCVDWDWKKVCHEECDTETMCHTETRRVC